MKLKTELRELSKRRTLLFGLVAFVLGVVVLWNGSAVTHLSITLLAIYLIGTGLSDLFLHLVLRRKEISITSSFWRIFVGIGLDLLNDFTSLPLNTLLILLGCYQLFMAAIYGVTFVLFRQNKIKGSWRFLFDTLLYGGIGISTIIAPNADSDLQFLFLGIYLIALGISNLRDGLFFDNDKDRNIVRRRMRVSLPIVIAAFIPAERLNQFNKILQGENPEQQEQSRHIVEKVLPSDLEVFVHTSETSFFGAIGHVDICYKGKVISYGNYDPFSERLFGTVGDGVLFKVDKKAYIELCKKESKKTLFGYSLHLTKEQEQAVEERLAEIDQLTYAWEPSSELKDGQHIYPYHLKYDLGAEVYKFKSGRFKTYFVLSTNCVLLADSILGKAGTDIVSPRGIIAPGTYQNYLQYELESSRDLVVAENIYQ